MTLGCRPPVSHARPAKAGSPGPPPAPRSPGWRPPHALSRRCFANAAAGGNGPRFLPKVTARCLRSLCSGWRQGGELGGALGLGVGGLCSLLCLGVRSHFSLPFLPAKKRFPLPLPLTSPPAPGFLSRFFLARGAPGEPSLSACPGMRKEEETGGM